MIPVFKLHAFTYTLTTGSWFYIFHRRLLLQPVMRMLRLRLFCKVDKFAYCGGPKYDSISSDFRFAHNSSLFDDIASQSVKKIIEINPYMLGTMAGGAADCQFWHRNLGVKCRLHELANKRRISVTGASKLLANILYSYRGMGLSVGTMIAGWDEKGPGLYYVDSEGGRLKGTRFSVGSGSPYAYGVLDSGYRYDMSVEEAAELARRAIYHATFRDGASGGVASVYHVGPNGWTKLSGDDVGELHYKYYPVEAEVVEQEMAELPVT
ncbi:proteasome subunit beta type-5-A-like [Olea europaea var. sylvestris]|uniref:proteasome subunit beta type-5-A-like n=1 Tax=Olea europaea var. sylvestris TaxID=158386 RepID=UPI000C1D81A0|nr:proteasome subunit beta type-5-A-like [Olea europaea var. sylvestris]